jgi:hypothetical protein
VLVGCGVNDTNGTDATAFREIRSTESIVERAKGYDSRSGENGSHGLSLSA